MLASQVPLRTLVIPGDERQTVTIRKLGFGALHDAETAMLMRGARLIREHGPTKPIEDFGGAPAGRAAAAARPWTKYDPAVLIERAVVAWDPPRPVPPDHSELQAWLAKEIAYFAVPSLRPEPDAM
jgi:hypothetical protein